MPTRYPVEFNHPDFLNPNKIDSEMRRVFEVCQGCRKCFNLCDSFPKLFDLIDNSKNEDLDSVDSNMFPTVVNSCTLCDICFTSKCPYVPPHKFNIDFPHLMLRYRMYQKKQGQLSKVQMQLAKIDRNANVGIVFSRIVNWLLNVKNTFFRVLLQFFIGIDKRVVLPKYNSETFENYSKNNLEEINSLAPAYGRKAVIYSTCFVNFNRKQTGVAAMKVLKKNGVKVEHCYPGCCGMPYLEQAELHKVVEQATKISKDLLQWVDKGYEVITLTASCGLMLKSEWSLLMPDNINIKKLSKHTKDIDEYIVDISQKEGLASGINKIDGGVTVHHACHARAQNMGNKARDMLRLIPNIKLDLVEKCAGHGGTFGVMKKTHDIARKIGKPVALSVAKKKNKYMASDCPLAGKHLVQMEHDIKIKSDEAIHPIEILAKAYKLV